MYDFIYNLWFIYHEFCMIGMGEKPRNIQNTKNKGKFAVWLSFHHPPPVDEMEANCFPVSENTETKPDLP